MTKKEEFDKKLAKLKELKEKLAQIKLEEKTKEVNKPIKK